MFQLIGHIHNNTLTLFTLDCLQTKQIPSWREERHMFKKESHLSQLSEFTQERATPSAELNPYSPLVFEAN